MTITNAVKNSNEVLKNNQKIQTLSFRFLMSFIEMAIITETYESLLVRKIYPLFKVSTHVMISICHQAGI